jgi:hypothetical protein
MKWNYIKFIIIKFSALPHLLHIQLVDEMMEMMENNEQFTLISDHKNT